MEKVLKRKQLDDIIILNFENVKRFNITLAEQVKSEINELITNGNSKIVFDLTGVSFIDSSGFGAMVSVYNFAKENNAFFKICCISKEAMELVVVTKLDKVFEIYNTVDDCTNSF